METPHTYQLLIRLGRASRITVGRLGDFRFPSGYYIYTGSARGRLESRVKRHLSKEKKLRWHIDYLLASPRASVEHVTLSSEEECALNARSPGDIPVPGFGASDCRAGCGSHLKYLGKTPPPASKAKKINASAGRLPK